MSRLEAATVVFSENFSSSTLMNSGNPYLGGWFTPQIAFQKWSSTTDASISNGALTVQSTNGTRSAGIILSPDIFPAAGSYTLSFDVASYTGDGNDNGLVTVWSGKNYDLTRASGRALILDTYQAKLRTEGSATASELGSLQFTSTGTKQITFNYDGSGAVALFFGAYTGGYPFPTVTYDNLSLTQNSNSISVPEPSTTALVSMIGLAGCFVRRRKA